MFALLLIIIAVCPLYVWRAGSLASGGPTGSFFVNLRGSMTWEGGVGPQAFGVLQYVVPLSLLLVAALELRLLAGATRIRAARRGKTLLALAVALALGLCILSTGRTFLFSLVIVMLSMPLILRRIRPKTALIGLLCFGIVVFVSIGLLLGKTGRVGQSFSSIAARSTESALTYVVGPTIAFDHVLQAKAPLQLGRNTFRFFHSFLYSMDLVRDNPAPLIQQYAPGSFPVNVYTVYQPYYQDFGLLGVLLAQFLFGLWHGFLYRRATVARPSAAYVLLYSLFMFPLFMQFFSDGYATSLSMWLQYLILVFLTTTLLARRGLLSSRQAPVCGTISLPKDPRE